MAPSGFHFGYQPIKVALFRVTTTPAHALELLFEADPPAIQKSMAHRLYRERLPHQRDRDTVEITRTRRASCRWFSTSVCTGDSGLGIAHFGRGEGAPLLYMNGGRITNQMCR